MESYDKAKYLWIIDLFVWGEVVSEKCFALMLLIQLPLVEKWLQDHCEINCYNVHSAGIKKKKKKFLPQIKIYGS